MLISCNNIRLFPQFASCYLGQKLLPQSVVEKYGFREWGNICSLHWSKYYKIYTRQHLKVNIEQGTEYKFCETIVTIICLFHISYGSFPAKKHTMQVRDCKITVYMLLSNMSESTASMTSLSSDVTRRWRHTAAMLHVLMMSTTTMMMMMMISLLVMNVTVVSC